MPQKRERQKKEVTSGKRSQPTRRTFRRRSESRARSKTSSPDGPAPVATSVDMSQTATRAPPVIYCLYARAAEEVRWWHSMTPRFSGEVVLVTGASGGIGAAVARHL